jgi:WD40 repeat protein
MMHTATLTLDRVIVQGILSSLRDQSINVWRIGTGELLSTLPADSGARVSQLVCAKNGSAAVCLYEYDLDETPSATENGEGQTQDVRILDMISGELSSRTVVRGSNEISCVTVSDDGRVAVVGTALGKFQFISAADHRVQEWTPPAEELGREPVIALGLSPDATSLFSAHALSSEVIEWEVRGVASELSEDADIAFEASQPTAVCRYDLGHVLVGIDGTQRHVAIRFIGGEDFFTVSDANHLRLFKVRDELSRSGGISVTDWNAAERATTSNRHWTARSRRACRPRLAPDAPSVQHGEQGWHCGAVGCSRARWCGGAKGDQHLESNSERRNALCCVKTGDALLYSVAAWAGTLSTNLRRVSLM